MNDDFNCNGCACHSSPPCSHCVDHVAECRNCGDLFASCETPPCREGSEGCEAEQ